jgi:hypothetical protein
MNDFESRGQIEGDVMNLYNKIYLDDEPIIGTMVTGLAVLMGSYQIVLIETVGDRELDAVMFGVFGQLSTTLYENAWVLHTTEEVTAKCFT